MIHCVYLSAVCVITGAAPCAIAAGRQFPQGCQVSVQYSFDSVFYDAVVQDVDADGMTVLYSQDETTE
jgi:hypothetical protein